MTRRIIAMIAMACAAIAFVPTASAEPVPVPPPPSAPIGLTQFGLAGKLDLLGTGEPSELDIPVAAGATLATLSGQVNSAVNVVNARVDVLDGTGTILGTIPAPVVPGTVPFAVDLSRAQILDGSAHLRLQLRDDRAQTPAPAPNSCSPIPEIALNQLGITYLGASANPSTVADFLPGYLSRVVIRVGTAPSAEVQQAALDLVARLTALYHPMPVRIDVDDSADGPAPAESDSRTIEITAQPEALISVRDGGTPTATLVIAGSGPALQNQIELFADRRVDLIQSPSATVTSATSMVPQSTRTMTFRQLGMASQTSALGTSTLYTGFDAAAFEVGPVEAADVHLIADYTPVVGGQGSVVVRAGSTVLASHALNDSGKLDIGFTVPADQITSKTGLALDVRYIPAVECAPLSDRMTFALNPSSTVSVTPGTRNRGGFPALPMALTPEFDVALGNPGQLKYAAAAINLMGQQSLVPLRPVLRPFDEAVGANTSLLIVGDGAQLAGTKLAAPLQPGSDASLTVNAPPVTAIENNSPIGAIQAFTAGDRAVLAITGIGDWSLVDRTFDYVWGLENRWSSLSGDVLATGAQNVTVNLTVREGGSIAPLPAPGDGWRWWVWVTIGVAAAAAVAMGLVLLIRWRRRDRAA